MYTRAQKVTFLLLCLQVNTWGYIAQYNIYIDTKRKTWDSRNSEIAQESVKIKKKSHSDSKATGWESNQSKWDYWTINMTDIMNIVTDIIKKIYVSLITPPKIN